MAATDKACTGAAADSAACLHGKHKWPGWGITACCHFCWCLSLCYPLQSDVLHLNYLADVVEIELFEISSCIQMKVHRWNAHISQNFLGLLVSLSQFFSFLLLVAITGYLHALSLTGRSDADGLGGSLIHSAAVIREKQTDYYHLLLLFLLIISLPESHTHTHTCTCTRSCDGECLLFL